MPRLRWTAALMFAVAFAAMSTQSQALTVRGTGTGALIGGDLTDPENNGDQAGNNYNVVQFFADQEASFGTGEAAFNVFDNVVGGGDDKWCCGNTPGGFPHFVGFQLATPKRLTGFTITSGNDTESRDPRVWSIEASNDGVNYTPIFSQNNPSASIWGPSGNRDQVIEFSAAMGDFAVPAVGSTFFRFFVSQTGAVGGADFQLSELEFFGIDNGAPLPPAPPTGQWNSMTFRRPGNAQITNLAGADDAINNGTLLGSGLVNSVNYADPSNGGGGGNFPGNFEPFGLSAGDDEDFTVKSTGFLQLTQGGTFQFRNNTDDGSRLRIDLNQNGVFDANETVILDDVLSGDHNADSAVLNMLAGQYMIEHVWFERGGGAQGDLGIGTGNGTFALLGNPQNDGAAAFRLTGAFVTAQAVAAVIPEPASAVLALSGLTLLGLRRRRVA